MGEWGGRRMRVIADVGAGRRGYRTQWRRGGGVAEAASGDGAGFLPSFLETSIFHLETLQTFDKHAKICQAGQHECRKIKILLPTLKSFENC